MTPGTDVGVTVGKEVWVGGMAVGVFSGTKGVGLGRMGVGLGGIRVWVGVEGDGRVQPARIMPARNREKKMDQGLIWDFGVLGNKEASFRIE
jgi:hypothetical protein